MATTYTLISSVTVGAGGASSIDFTSIPSTYTDLCLLVSSRSSASAGTDLGLIGFNGSTASFTNKYLGGNGSIAYSGSYARYIGDINAATSTASTFTNLQIYIPNYAGSSNKSFSSDTAMETNATGGVLALAAGLWSNTAAINQVTLTFNTGSFVQYSTAYLYGISKS